MKILSNTAKRRIYSLLYKLFCIFFKQKNILLYYSRESSCYTNIKSISDYFDNISIKYSSLEQDELNSSIITSLMKIAKAKVIVIDSSSPAAIIKLNKNTKLINCWHACGAYKKIGFDAKRVGYNDENEEKRIARIHRSISYFICSSDYVAKIYREAFRLSSDRVKAIGVPRTDRIVNSSSIYPSKFTILYAPTFRTINGKRIHIEPPPAELIRRDLSKYIQKDIILALRRHPTCENRLYDGWEDWSDRSLEDALVSSSILITDYSSIFFDFILLDRPVIFYMPDFDTYINSERSLYFLPQEEFQDSCCFNLERLLQLIKRYHNTDIDYASFKHRYMSSCDGNSTQRVCNLILSALRD